MSAKTKKRSSASKPFSMFLVTNRQVEPEADGLKKLGEKPNSDGPHELRLAQATKKNGKWNLTILPNKADDAMKEEVDLADAGEVLTSRYVSKKLLDGLKKNGRNFLFFVHGFNNDIKAVLDRAEAFSRQYNLEVMAFSWPANGGGLKGVADYLSDKRDALASVGALGRTFEKLSEYLSAFHEERDKAIKEKAQADFPDDAVKRDEFMSAARDKKCAFTTNLVLHSMGNYVFKHMMQSSVHVGGRKLIFDNVVLAAADTNNENHAQWVDRINCRKRIYITINEDDSALRVSRMKLGSQQKARLGHYVKNLHSELATYVNFTNARHVGSSHAYFEGKPTKNEGVRDFFRKAFNGERAEEGLIFDAARRMYFFERSQV